MFWNVIYKDHPKENKHGRMSQSMPHHPPSKDLVKESLNLITKFYQDQEGLKKTLIEKKLSLWFKSLHSPRPSRQADALHGLSIIIRSINSVVISDYLIKDNKLTEIINAPLTVDNEEVVAHLITLLKTIANRLIPEDIVHITDSSKRSFPLLASILRHTYSIDIMVRNCARLAATRIFSLCDDLNSWIIEDYASGYFEYLVASIKQKISNLEDIEANKNSNSVRVQLYSDYCQELDYFNEILNSKSRLIRLQLQKILIMKLFCGCLLPSVSKERAWISDTNFRMDKILKFVISKNLALQLLSAFLERINDKMIHHFVLGITEEAYKRNFSHTNGILSNSGFIVQCSLIIALRTTIDAESDGETLCRVLKVLSNIQNIKPALPVDIFIPAILTIHNKICENFSEQHCCILDETIKLIKQLHITHNRQAKLIILGKMIAEIYSETVNNLINKYKHFKNLFSDVRAAYIKHIANSKRTFEITVSQCQESETDDVSHQKNNEDARVTESNQKKFKEGGLPESYPLKCHYECCFLYKRLQLLFHRWFFVHEVLVVTTGEGILPSAITKNILHVGQYTDIANHRGMIELNDYLVSIQGQQFSILRKSSESRAIVAFSRFIPDIKVFIDEGIIQIYSIKKNNCLYSCNTYHVACQIEFADKLFK